MSDKAAGGIKAVVKVVEYRGTPYPHLVIPEIHVEEGEPLKEGDSVVVTVAKAEDDV